MYMRGLNLKGMGNSEEDYYAYLAYGDDAPAPVYPAVTQPAQTGPGVNFDWTGIIKTAADAWGKITVAQTQADIAKLQAQNPYARYPYYGSAGGVYSPYGTPLTPTLPGAPGYLPWSGAGVGGSGSTILILGAAALAVFFLLRR